MNSSSPRSVRSTSMEGHDRHHHPEETLPSHALTDVIETRLGGIADVPDEDVAFVDWAAAIRVPSGDHQWPRDRSISSAATNSARPQDVSGSSGEASSRTPLRRRGRGALRRRRTRPARRPGRGRDRRPLRVRSAPARSPPPGRRGTDVPRRRTRPGERPRRSRRPCAGGALSRALAPSAFGVGELGLGLLARSTRGVPSRRPRRTPIGSYGVVAGLRPEERHAFAVGRDRERSRDAKREPAGSRGLPGELVEGIGRLGHERGAYQWRVTVRRPNGIDGWKPLPETACTRTSTTSASSCDRSASRRSSACCSNGMPSRCSHSSLADARRRVGGRAGGEDIAEAFASRTRFRDQGADGAAWLYGIGRNLLRGTSATAQSTLGHGDGSGCRNGPGRERLRADRGADRLRGARPPDPCRDGDVARGPARRGDDAGDRRPRIPRGRGGARVHRDARSSPGEPGPATDRDRDRDRTR